MLRPNLIVIGAQTAGTTWLHRRLDEHPDVFMTTEKEANFFLAGRTGERLEDYAARFAGGEGAVYRGESTPAYFWTPAPGETVRERVYGGVPEWIGRICGPDVRLLLALRDPVARAISAYFHHFRARRFRLGQSILEVGDQHGIVDIGRYSRHWAYWTEHFDRSSFLVTTLEAVRGDPVRECRRLYAGLGLPPVRNAKARLAENIGFRLDWDGRTITAAADAGNRWTRRFGGAVERGEMPTVSRDDILALIDLFADEYAFLNALQDDHRYEPDVDAVVRNVVTTPEASAMADFASDLEAFDAELAALEQDLEGFAADMRGACGADGAGAAPPTSAR